MSTTTHPVQSPPGAGPRPARRWTTGRVVALSLASAAVLGSAAMAAVAGGIHLIDAQRREGDYLTTDTVRLSSAGHAVTVEEIDLDGLSGDWLLGTARLRATASEGTSVFIGVAPTDDVAEYLDDVAYSTVTELDDAAYDEHRGGSPTEPPADADIWSAQASGPGTQTVTWEPKDGDWTVVMMNLDGSSGVDVRADVGATAPILTSAVFWLLTASAVTGAVGALALLLLLLWVRRHPVSV